MTTGLKPLTIIGSLDDMITFSDPVITPRDYLLFHWFDHRFDKLDFFVCKVVLLVEFFIRPGLGKVLEGDEGVHFTCRMLGVFAK